MKKTFYTLTIPILAIGLILGNNILAQDGITKVLADKTFTVNSNANFVVNHEHGKVVCKNWDKNEIGIVLTAHAKTDDNEKAEKAFKRISWEVKGNSDEVVVQSKLTGKSGGGSPNVWADLEIHMPESINLNFAHKFGKAYIETVNGIALITSDYGSINVNDITNTESKFKVTYGDAQVNEFNGNSIVAQYAKFSFDEAGDVSIKSDYSDVEGDEAGNVLVKLEGGNLNLDEVISINGSSSFSSLNIDRLKNSMDIETGYGSLNVDHVSEGFSEINVENNFGSTNLGIPSSASYLFEATSTHGSIVYPEDDANITYREKTTQKTILKGSIGDKSNTKSKVSLKSNYGSINITK